MSYPILRLHASEYAKLSHIDLDLEIPLGHGTDGQVWKSSRQTAVKALLRERNYAIERECYQRLKGTQSILGFSVPQLVQFDDRLLIIEMKIVAPPYILDFAKSWLDSPADYTQEILDDWDRDGQERFGDRWHEVRALLWALTRFGIYYYDAKPANIAFKDVPGS